jgi:hypothetical protein
MISTSTSIDECCSFFILNNAIFQSGICKLTNLIIISIKRNLYTFIAFAERKEGKEKI